MGACRWWVWPILLVLGTHLFKFISYLPNLNRFDWIGTILCEKSEFDYISDGRWYLNIFAWIGTILCEIIDLDCMSGGGCPMLMKLFFFFLLSFLFLFKATIICNIHNHIIN